MIEHIIKEAGECGACEKWYNNTNRNNLLEKYIMNVDWCMESGYPTKETFRQNTSEDELSQSDQLKMYVPFSNTNSLVR